MSSLDPITSPISMENHNHTTTSPNSTNHNTPPESPHEKLIRLLNHSANGRSVSCYGNLYKKPEKNSFLWKRRFCVIYHGILTIYYYENEEKAKNGELRGKIPFCSVHEWDGKPNGFQFFTPTEKCYYVYTEKLDERQKWINHMQSEIDSSVPAKDGITIPYKRQISLSKLDLAENMNLNINAMNQTWIGENPDIKSLLQEISDLRHECSYLKEEIKVYEKAEEEGTINKAIVQTRRRQDSILDDGTTVHLKPSEMQRMRQIFNLFDTKHTGVISAADLRRLHQRLGEPISDAEANEALEFLQSVNHGKLDFTAFIKWWNEDHSMSKEKTDQIKRYQAKFKFLKARITNPDIGHIVTEACGAFPSFEFRLKFFYMNDDGQKEQISPWHDIPLYNSDGSVNFICEIPKWTRKKMEIATGEPFNPIKQDTKNGKLREYTFGDMMFNYGALPQTWEDPSHVTEGTGCIGDNDPIDVIEIGTKQWPTGAIVQVKILGVLALIDSGETDWKVICINVEDHYAPILNDVADVDAQVPGCIAAIRDWLRDYKTPNINKYGYEEKCMSREFAESVVQETHDFWKVLVEERGEHATV